MKKLRGVINFISKLGKYGGLIVSILSILNFAQKELEKHSDDEKETVKENS